MLGTVCPNDAIKDTKDERINMTSIIAEQQAFRDMPVSFGLSLTNVYRIVGQSITETMDLVMIDSDTLFIDDVVVSSTSGITTSQK